MFQHGVQLWPNIMFPKLQLISLLQLTHGFGPLAFVAVFDTLLAMLDDMLKCCDRNEHLNVPLSVISVTHIPANRVAYNNNSNM